MQDTFGYRRSRLNCQNSELQQRKGFLQIGPPLLKQWREPASNKPNRHITEIIESQKSNPVNSKYKKSKSLHTVVLSQNKFATVSLNAFFGRYVAFTQQFRVMHHRRDSKQMIDQSHFLSGLPAAEINLSRYWYQPVNFHRLSTIGSTSDKETS